MRYSDDDFRKTLSAYWGYDDFRGVQLDIIRHIAHGHDTLGLMPTGGGKSVTFQVPGLMMEGTVLVISPLIALMKDQVVNLRRRGIMATALYSGMEAKEIQREIENCIFGANKFLYVSPERLSSASFRERLKRINISFVTVDEAHCISQWGYDFRPPYLEIANVRELFADVPILALTATATPQVVDDICRCLHFREGSEVFRMSFERKNLSYVVREAEDKVQEMLHILRSVPGSAIVYSRNRKDTREIAQWLKKKGISATYFHAGLTNVDKDVRQKMWQEDEVRVMVATNAFGMGIDKPDVRVVVHVDVPDSIEAYFQEAGRGGRDGERSWAVLLVNGRDESSLRQRVVDSFPDREYIRKVYDALCYYCELALGDGCGARYEFDVEKFCVNFHFFPVPMMSAVQLLCRAGYLEYDENEHSVSRMQMLMSRREVYEEHFYWEQDQVLNYIMRHCTGIFSEYVYIDECRIANDLQMPRRAVYEALKTLNRQRVLHYVPRKNVPYVRFVQRRVLSEQIKIGREVYEDRKNDLEKRVEAMVAYATGKKRCRSRVLLRYFGEEVKCDCGQCDVCIGRKKQLVRWEGAEDMICAWLEERGELLPEDLRNGDYGEEEMGEALRRLEERGVVVLKEGRLVSGE